MRISLSESENWISPGLSRGLGRSGDPGKKSNRINDTEIVKSPSTILY